jgi:hypothetical protein
VGVAALALDVADPVSLAGPFEEEQLGAQAGVAALVFDIADPVGLAGPFEEEEELNAQAGVAAFALADPVGLAGPFEEQQLGAQAGVAALALAIADPVGLDVEGPFQVWYADIGGEVELAEGSDSDDDSADSFYVHEEAAENEGGRRLRDTLGFALLFGVGAGVVYYADLFVDNVQPTVRDTLPNGFPGLCEANACYPRGGTSTATTRPGLRVHLSVCACPLCS